jgi:heat shock protein HtpX
VGPELFFERQARNRRLTFLIVLCFVLVFILVGASVDALYLDSFASGKFPLPVATLVSLAFAAVMALSAYYRGGGWILAALGAERLDSSLPDHRELHNLVTEMALASGSRMPRVYVIFDPSPNAFATGRNEQDASICVTTGLLALLSRQETQGVVAHEIAHIRNQDILLMTIVSVLVGGIALLSDWAQRSFYSVGARRRLRGKTLWLAIPALLLLAFSPLISRFLAMAVSRQREYLADATAAEFTRNPRGLAQALEKIRDAAMPFHRASRGTAHLFFVNPLRRRVDDRDGRMADLLSSHPPVDSRIALLYGMAGLQPDLRREG